MLLDFVFHALRRDPTVKRHALKAVSWRVIGTVDTMFIGFLITGSAAVGAKIGALEVVTKMVLYFLHERVWHRIRFGQPVALRQQLTSHDLPSLSTGNAAPVARKQREAQNGHPALTLWLTGLSGAGKSTLAAALDHALFAQGIPSRVLDGDATRMGLNRDLSFSREGRQENIRRVAEVAKLFNESGTIVLAAFISPYAEDRAQARAIIGEGHFAEIHVAASLETCIGRDAKGLYRKALAGEIKGFTGIDSPYEAPEAPDLVVRTDELPLDACVAQVLRWLATQRGIPATA